MLTLKRCTWLHILLILGMLVSAFLIYEHFAEGSSGICNFGESLDCGVVNQSPYATLDGISYLLTIDLGMPFPLIDIASTHFILDFLLTNAFLGLLTLLFMLFIVRANHKGKDFLWIKKENNLKWLRGIATFSVIYGFYLFLVQHFLLGTYCVFCIALDAILILILITVWTAHSLKSK